MDSSNSDCCCIVLVSSCGDGREVKSPDFDCRLSILFPICQSIFIFYSSIRAPHHCRLVPALNVIADRFKIPDDIAGTKLPLILAIFYFWHSNEISFQFHIVDWPNCWYSGATLMAAGASSPELFSSFVALFITHSAMGMGTVSPGVWSKRLLSTRSSLLFFRLLARRFSISWWFVQVPFMLVSGNLLSSLLRRHR